MLFSVLELLDWPPALFLIALYIAIYGLVKDALEARKLPSAKINQNLITSHREE